MERIGTLSGIIGALLVALKMGNIGYPFFLISSLFLMVSALKGKQSNYIALQGTFLVCNIIGLVNYI